MQIQLSFFNWPESCDGCHLFCFFLPPIFYYQPFLAQRDIIKVTVELIYQSCPQTHLKLIRLALSFRKTKAEKSWAQAHHPNHIGCHLFRATLSIVPKAQDFWILPIDLNKDFILVLFDSDNDGEIGKRVGLKDNFLFLQVGSVNHAKLKGAIILDGGVKDGQGLILVHFNYFLIIETKFFWFGLPNVILLCKYSQTALSSFWILLLNVKCIREQKRFNCHCRKVLFLFQGILRKQVVSCRLEDVHYSQLLRLGPTKSNSLQTLSLRKKQHQGIVANWYNFSGSMSESCLFYDICLCEIVEGNEVVVGDESQPGLRQGDSEDSFG